MFITECLDINKKGHLTIGDCDTVDLAEKYGTPLYVMDEEAIRKTASIYRKSIKKYFDGNGMVLYASKALSCKEIYRIIHQEDLGVDVVSEGEIYTALQAGFPASKMYFHGNNKTVEELEFALDQHVGHIVVDNFTELALLDELSGRRGQSTDILLRIKPGIDAHTHSFIRTGQIDSKFGLALETGEAEEAVQKAIAYKNVNLTGVHCHIGSQIFEVGPFKLAAEVMVNLIADITEKYGVAIRELDLGGGFGVKHLTSQEPVAYDAYMREISQVVKSTCEKRKLPVPFILIEPGRSLVAPAGITLYTVGGVKKIPDIRTYVSVDGGMTDNPRYALYDAKYEVVIANRAAQKETEKVTVAGKCCESGDIIQENVPIPETQPGDILAVLATGAYNYSMASNYNRIPRPAMVMVKNGVPRVIIRRETNEDLVKNDI